MKYLLVALFLAAVAGAEIYHELSHDDVVGVATCYAPASRQGVLQELLLHHLRSH